MLSQKLTMRVVKGNSHIKLATVFTAGMTQLNINSYGDIMEDTLVEHKTSLFYIRSSLEGL